jgi:glc operon protein GlcG
MRISIAFGFALGVLAFLAQDAAAQFIEKKVLTLAAARKMVAAAEAEAERHHLAGVVAVVDDGGWPILIERMDHAAYIASVELAPGKARTAALFKKPSEALEDAINNGRIAAVTARLRRDEGRPSNRGRWRGDRRDRCKLRHARARCADRASRSCGAQTLARSLFTVGEGAKSDATIGYRTPSTMLVADKSLIKLTQPEPAFPGLCRIAVADLATRHASFEKARLLPEKKRASEFD